MSANRHDLLLEADRRFHLDPEFHARVKRGTAVLMVDMEKHGLKPADTTVSVLLSAVCVGLLMAEVDPATGRLQ